ncbi:hypothetical protein ABMX48_36325 [Streptomyces cavourensis]
MAALKEQKEDLHRVYVLEDEHEAAVVQAAQAQQRYEQLGLASSLVCFGCFELPCAVLLVLQSVGHLLERQPQLLVALLRLRGLDDGRCAVFRTGTRWRSLLLQPKRDQGGRLVRQRAGAGRRRLALHEPLARKGARGP